MSTKVAVILIVIMGSLSVATGILMWKVGSSFFDLPGASQDVEDLYAHATDLGMPLTAEELNLHPPIPAAENAAPELAAAADELHKIIKKADLDSMIMDGDPKELAVAREKLTKGAAAFTRAEKASQLKHCRFDRNWDEAHLLDFPEYEALRELAPSFADRGLLRAYDGDYAAAVADFRTALRIGRLVGQEPTIVSLLNQVRAQAAVIIRLNKALALDPSDKVIETLRPVMEEMAEDRIIISDHLAYEFYVGVAAARNLKRFGGVDGIEDGTLDESHELISSGLPKDMESRAYLARHLELWSEVWALGEDMADNDLVFDVMYWLENSIYDDYSTSNELSYAITPDYWTPMTYVFRLEVERLLTLAAMDVVKFQNKTGRLPKDLAQAGFKTLDPMMDEPFHLLPRGTGFRVYSPGLEGEDDGGVRAAEMSKDATVYDADIVIDFPYKDPSRIEEH